MACPQLNLKHCPVCGGSDFQRKPVLWAELIGEWGLSPEEVAYIDDQQGFACVACGSNLRSMTLASAIMSCFSFPGRFDDFCRHTRVAREWTLLEVNRAGTLTPYLELFANHRLAEYPSLDMQNMSELAATSVDIVVHSDTLEHVPDPVAALSECRRVLTGRGFLAYTVPVVAGRLTRKRDGLPPSYHGDPAELREDIKVMSEYGSDYWCQLMQAGFRRVEIHSLAFPQSVATVAWK